MATTKKQKKKADTVVHEADLQGNLIFASPLDLQEHSIDPAPETAMQAPITNEMLNRVEIARVMEKEYGKYRHDLAGLLWSILGELVARRVNK